MVVDTFRVTYISTYHYLPNNGTTRDSSLNPTTVVVDTIRGKVTYMVLPVPKKGIPRDISLTGTCVTGRILREGGGNERFS